MGVPEQRQIIWKTTIAVIVGLALVWTYWTTLEGLSSTWTTDPNYSQGFLIPILALAILCQRLWGCAAGREQTRPVGTGTAVAGDPPAPGRRLLLLHSPRPSVTPPRPAGARLAPWGARVLEAGLASLRVSRVHDPHPQHPGRKRPDCAGLQDLSTAASTFTLQTLGQVAYREGNVILLKDTELGVVEACAGVRMLMVFCAMATTTAILLPYGWKRRTILIASAIPLAILCNIVRITVAGLASQSLGSEWGHYVFHDLAGFVMVPLAFALLGAEILLLGRLFKTGAEEAPALDLSRMVAMQGGNLPASVAGAR